MPEQIIPLGFGGSGGGTSNTNSGTPTGNNTSVPTLNQNLPINSVNYPTKNVNDLGLTTISRPNTIQQIEPVKKVLEKLVDGDNDFETIDVASKAINFVINVVDDVYVETPDIREITYPKVVSGADFVGYDTTFDISWNSVNATYVKIFIGKSTDFVRVSPKGQQTFNVKELLEKYGLETYDDGDKVKIPLRLIPVNESGNSVVEGPVEDIPIIFDKGDLDIPRSVAINRIAEGFIAQFKEATFDESKYLTHLLHLGNGDNKVITTWRGLIEDTDSSLILKLYEPLPTSVQPNQKVWITKAQTEPLFETITIVGEDTDYCPPLKGPNFSLEVDNGIGYEIYDNLIASGSNTSTSLIQNYISKTGIDTEKLNIQYASGSVYTFDNFVHFGSAEERIKNFWYKIELLESYQSKYSEVSTSNVQLRYVTTEDGFVLVTESDVILEFQSTALNAISQIQAKNLIDKINNLIGTFDGFEMWLYTDTQYSDSLSYPKNTGLSTIKPSTDSESIAWYNSAITYASSYDKNNVNYLNNNLPEFIKEDYQNADFMLFMDMIGQHFDVLWVYINALTKLKNLNQHSTTGFANDLVYAMLESLGWDGKKAYDSQFLWEYALGQYKDGTQKYNQSLKSANEEVWRRILNNLPYLLKHKGTARSLKAVMACYGVPQSLLTIMEFGGPTDPTDGGTQPFTFDDRTAAVNFTSNGEYVSSSWNSADSTYPNSIELRINLQHQQNNGIVKAIDGSTDMWKLEVTQTTGSFGKLDFYVSESWSGTIHSASTSEFNIFNEDYTQVVLNRTLTDGTSSFQMFAKDAITGRIRTTLSSTPLLVNGDTSWDSGSAIHIGYAMSGSMDEFRLWKTPLEEGVIDTHTLLPDATNGNNYTASTEDLWVRYDFEYPKNLNVSSSIPNVAISSEYGNVSASAYGFSSITDYPYHYTSYERTVTAKVPSLGFNQADKIRFETQTLVGDLSHKVRATQKSLDRAPIDSSRLGLFFSPMKELNMDIIKSFGTFNIDNYIGSPADEYNDEYTQLKVVRDYYFQRLNRNIYEYINLVRHIDKSLFEVLEQLIPARAKVSKGLLIEPHYLERSKTKWQRPTSERRDYESSIDIDNDVILIGDNTQFEALVDAESNVQLSHQYDNYDANVAANDEINLVSDVPSYESSIDATEDTNLVGDYPTYNVEIEIPKGEKLEATVDAFSSTQIGMERDSLDNAGFGLYTPIPATGSVTTLDIFGNLTSSRQQIYLVKEQYIEKVQVQTEGWPATTNNEQVKYEIQEVTNYRYKVSKVPVGTSIPTIGNNIVEVTPLNGYFPSHYRYKNNLPQGLVYSFFEGSQQTSATTPDGLEPVETFTTNPNILRVANTGRGSGEPILEVD